MFQVMELKRIKVQINFKTLFSWMSVPNTVIEQACLYLKIVGAFI